MPNDGETSETRHYTGGSTMTCLRGPGWYFDRRRSWMRVRWERWVYWTIISPLNLVRCGACLRLRRRKNGRFGKSNQPGPWLCFSCLGGANA